MNTRRAFTLVELMVTLGVIGILVSLLLVGVFGSIESARRMSCQNNLRQIGLALLAYESSYSHFPVAFKDSEPVEVQSTDAQGLFFFGPHVHLLPYLDLGAHAVDLRENVAFSVPKISKLDVPIYRCPSDGKGTPLAVNYFLNQGVAAHLLEGSSEPGCGPFFMNRPLSTALITDGRTTTVASSERLRGSDPMEVYKTPMLGHVDKALHGKLERDPWVIPQTRNDYPGIHQVNRWTEFCSQNFQSGSMYQVLSGVFYFDNGYLYYSHILPPNSPVYDCRQHDSYYDYGLKTSRSHHRGGVQSLYCDGHVSFSANSIDYQVWRAVGTIATGEIDRTE